MMEGYILAGRNIPESEFKEKFKNIYGAEELSEFENLFRNNFIREEDFKAIASFGANALRLPFNSRLVESGPFEYDKKGLEILRNCLSWAHKYKLGVILDLHAVSGAQNIDWHSDSRGEALFWTNEEYQKRACALWEKIAGEFKDFPGLLGYDVLNEPVPAQGRKDTSSLKALYKNIIKVIRSVDKRHCIFLEGDNYAQSIDFLQDLVRDDICASIHTYLPLNYVFNFTPFLKFPGKIDSWQWDEAALRKHLEPYYKFSIKNKTKIFVGEFGINWRSGLWGELDWLGSILKVFEDFGFGYTYWTYKAVANNCFPDGLYQYIENNEYIKREGPVYGWENYLLRWGREKARIADFWLTKNFSANTRLISRLKKSFEK